MKKNKQLKEEDTGNFVQLVGLGEFSLLLRGLKKDLKGVRKQAIEIFARKTFQTEGSKIPE
jgi:hypothetical protein